MKNYDSPESIQDSMELDEIRQELKDLGVKFHPATGAEKLSKLLFDQVGTGVATMEKPKNDDFFADIAKEIRSEVAKIKKGTEGKVKTYLSKNHNTYIHPSALSKSGKRMRYVKGSNTLDIAEQRATMDVIPLEPIKFKGAQPPIRMGKFEGRGVLTTSDDVLCEFIESLTEYGSSIVKYDSKELQKESLERTRKESLLNAAIFQASDNDLIRVITTIDLSVSGRDTFDRWYQAQRDDLEQTAIRYASNDADAMLNAMESKVSKVVFLVNLSKKMGIINVTPDGKEVRLSSTGITVVHSSLSTGWQSDMRDHLVSPEGQKLLDKLEVATGYNVR